MVEVKIDRREGRIVLPETHVPWVVLAEKDLRTAKKPVSIGLVDRFRERRQESRSLDPSDPVVVDTSRALKRNHGTLLEGLPAGRPVR